MNEIIFEEKQILFFIEEYERIIPILSEKEPYTLHENFILYNAIENIENGIFSKINKSIYFHSEIHSLKIIVVEEKYFDKKFDGEKSLEITIEIKEKLLFFIAIYFFNKEIISISSVFLPKENCDL